MNNILKSEQLIQFVLAVLALYYQPISLAWWLWILLFLAPDISMVGYLVNTRIGALFYNIAHHKAVAGLFICVGIGIHAPWILLAGLLLWAHSSFDRVMGYGLKYADSFQHTHLGFIGKKPQSSK